MNQSEYTLMRDGATAHWWYRGRKKIVDFYLKKYLSSISRRIVCADAGCGYGEHIPLLQSYGDVFGLELTDDAIQFLSSAAWETTLGQVTIRQWKCPEPVPQLFDCILMTDVLEHIENDIEAVDWLYQQLAENGYALITVPALKYLWTDMDDVVQHYRRYSKKELLFLFSKRFTILRVSYYNFFLFPVKVLFVVYMRIRVLFFPNRVRRSFNDIPPRVVNALFAHILYFESWLLRWISFPFGASLIILVQKKQEEWR